MIVEGILKFFLGLLKLLVSLLPSIEIPDNFLSSLGDVAELLSYVSIFLPLGTIVSCLAVIFTLQNAKFFLSIFNFIVKKIPGFG